MKPIANRENLLTGLTGLLIFGDMVGYTALIPLLPDLQRLLQVDETQVGLLVAGLAYGTLVFSLPMAALAGRLGPRRVALSGSGLIAVAFLLTWFLPSFGWILAARVLHGIASSALWVAAPTWVVAATTENNVARVATRVTGIGMLGTIVGPAFGGWLATPSDPLRAFLFIGVALAGVTLVGVLTTRVVGSVEVTKPPRLRDVTAVWRSPLFLVGSIIVIAAATAGSAESVIIALGLGEREVSQRAMGILFSVGGAGLAVAQAVSYRFLPRSAPHRRGVLVLAILTLVVGAAFIFPNVVGFSVTLLMLPVAGGLGYGISIAFLSDGAEETGSTMAVGVAYWSILWAVGASLGPTSYGWVLEAAGESSALLAVMVTTVVLAAAVWVVGRARLPLPSNE